MNKKNLNRIFNRTECFSDNKLSDYLNNTLSEKQKNSIEVHMATCKICRDVFEGLSMIKDISKLEVIVADLNRKVEKRVAEKTKTRTLIYPLIKLAAAIIILFTIGWFIKSYMNSTSFISNNEMATLPIDDYKVEMNSVTDTSEQVQNKSFFGKNEKVENGIITKNDKIEIKPLQIDAEIDNSQLDEEEFPVDEYDIHITVAINLKEVKSDINIVKDENFEPNNVKNRLACLRTVKKETGIADEESVTEKKQPIVNAGFTDDISNENNYFFSNTIATDNFSQAMTNYNQKKYTKAIELFKESLAVPKNTDKAHYYLAMSYINLNDFHNAINNFDKVIATGLNLYYEKALWNKSQILLYLKDKKSAISTLKLLRNYNGDYLNEVNSLIDYLNNR